MKPGSDLTKRQIKAAKTLRERRPMCLPGTNAIILEKEASVWHDEVIDDPQNQQELDMSKKAVAARARAEKALTKVRAAKAAKFQPVGIRFLYGPSSLAQIYTYKAKRAAKLTLGQEVIVRNSRGTNVGVVVTLDEAIPKGWVLDTLTELTHKVAAI